ncbi:MAG TPA: hypothetical protein VH008_23165 [Pseudonocardia sp.]|nr:hypothetical protein [Pseudonocardia sp.]
MARRPPVLPWLMGAALVLAVLVLVGASALVVPMLLAMAGAGYAAWRWWSAMAVAGRMNDEVRTGPGRHARSDESVDLSALVPGQRSESPVLPTSTAAGSSAAARPTAVGSSAAAGSTGARPPAGGSTAAAGSTGARPPASGSTSAAGSGDRSGVDRSEAGSGDAGSTSGEGRHRSPQR